MLVKNLIVFGLSHFIKMLAPLLILPLLSRRLSDDLFGLYMYTLAISAWLTILIEYGFNIASTRDVAQTQDMLEIREIYISTQSAKYILGLLSALGFSITCQWIPLLASAPLIWKIFPWLLALFTALIPYFYFQGKERFSPISFGESFVAILTVISIYLLVHSDADVGVVLFVLLVGRIALWLLLSIWASRDLNIRLGAQFSYANGLHRLRISWNIFLFQAVSSLYTSFNTVYLGFFCSPSQIGIYATAEKIVKAMCGMFWQLSSVIFPRVNSLKGKNQSLRTVRIISLLIFLMCATGAVFSLHIFDQKIATYFHMNEKIFIPLLEILSFAMPAIIASSVLGMQYLIVEGMEKIFNRIVLFGGIFNIGVAYYLIPTRGVRGMGTSWVMTEWIVLILVVNVIAHRRKKMMIISTF